VRIYDRSQPDLMVGSSGASQARGSSFPFPLAVFG